MNPRTIAVPMSGWARIRTQAKPVTRISGPMMRRSVAPSSSRRVMKSAAKSVSASFMSSEGCRRNCPKPTQRLDPMTSHPEPGHQDDEEEPDRHHEQQGADPPQLAVVDAHRQPQRHHTDRHPHGLPDQDRPRRAVGRDGDHRGGGSDHHEPDHAEQTRRRRGAASRSAPGARRSAVPWGPMPWSRGGPAIVIVASPPGAAHPPAPEPAGRVVVLFRAGVMSTASHGRGRASLPGPTPDAWRKSPASRGRSGG